MFYRIRKHTAIYYERGIKAFFALMLTFLMTACNGQEKHRAKVKQADALKAQAQLPYIDPLFFIDGQLCQHIREIFQDQHGNLWFGTNVYGIMRHDGDSLVYFNKTNGYDFGRITGIVEDAVGNIWFGTYLGLHKYDGKTFSAFEYNDALPSMEIWILYIDSKGRMWIGTTKGLAMFDGQTIHPIEIPKPKLQNPEIIFSADRIVSIVEDGDGNLWFGTDGFGICKYDGHSFITFTTKDGLTDNTICDMLIDSKGRLWVGTFFGGLSVYQENTFMNYTQNGAINGVEVGGFFEDEHQDVWFAVENDGVYRYRNDTLTNYSKKQGLITNGILSIYKDNENRFWFGGWGGLFRYNDNVFVPVTQKGAWE